MKRSFSICMLGLFAMALCICGCAYVKQWQSKPQTVSFIAITVDPTSKDLPFAMRHLFKFGTSMTSGYSGHNEEFSWGESLVMTGAPKWSHELLGQLGLYGKTEIIARGKGEISNIQNMVINLSRESELSDLRMPFVVNVEQNGREKTVIKTAMKAFPNTMSFNLAGGKAVALAQTRGEKVVLLFIGVDMII